MARRSDNTATRPYLVTRTQHVEVQFVVWAHSQKEARKSPTPETVMKRLVFEESEGVAQSADQARRSAIATSLVDARYSSDVELNSSGAARLSTVDGETR